MANNVNVKAVITAEDRASSVLKSFSNSVGDFGHKMANTMKTASLAFTAAGTAAGTFAVKSAANFEQTRIGLENMLGSADSARKVLKDVSKFAAETPFEFPELANSVKQLVGFGFSAESAVDTMKQLGDVSAAIGAPIGDLSYLMGTLKTQGRALTIDIRQFAQRGVPIYEYLAKTMKTTTENVSELVTAGKVGFPEVQAAFKAMTGEGGKFHGAMAKQSKSLSGLFSTLKDSIGQTARELVGITQEGDVKEGSLFDILRKTVAILIQELPYAIEQAKAVIADLWESINQVAEAIGNYLGPKLEALWNTLQTQVIPVLMRLWDEVLKPLIPVIGGLLVGAIGLVIDALNLFFKVLSPIINWMLDNEIVVLGFAAAFTALGVAMKFGAIVTAFQGAIATATASVGTAITKVASLNTALTGFAGWGLFAGAAVLAFSTIQQQFEKTKQVIENTNKALTSTEGALATAKQQYDSGKITKERYNAILSGAYSTGNNATGTDYWRGGPTWVGEQGPEIINAPRGSQIIPNNKTSSTGNTTNNFNVNIGMYAGTEVEKRKVAKELFGALQDIASMHGSSVTELFG